MVYCNRCNASSCDRRIGERCRSCRHPESMYAYQAITSPHVHIGGTSPQVHIGGRISAGQIRANTIGSHYILPRQVTTYRTIGRRAGRTEQIRRGFERMAESGRRANRAAQGLNRAMRGVSSKAQYVADGLPDPDPEYALWGHRNRWWRA